MQYKGKTAVITGASSGIGLEYAKEFAKRGSNLVLAARSKEALEKLAAELRGQNKISVQIIALDLATASAGDELMTNLQKLNVDVDFLINNAGFGTNTRVSKEDRSRVRMQLMLNVVTLVDLTIALLPALLKKDSGAIINIGSTASFQPVPGMAVYAATKAFVRSFTEALWGEVRNTNVKVLTVNPGATATEFFNVAGAKPSGKLAPASDVIVETFEALESSKSHPSIVIGSRNRAMARLTRFIPEKTVISVAGKLFLND